MDRKSFFRANSNEKQKKFFKVSIIILILIFFGIIIFSIINFFLNIDKTSEIKILVAPSDAIVKINGEIYPTNTTIKVVPGTYDVKIDKTGFISYHNSITANANETAYLYEYLNEEDENGTFYKDNEKEAGIAQRISDFRADKFHEDYTGTDPIWGVTPYSSYQEGIKISAEKSGSKVKLNVYLYTCLDDEVQKLKQKALNYLEENNINLKNYDISYSNC